MYFFLSSPEYKNWQNNVLKVNVHLTSGIAQILENHQDLLGKVENNFVEIENNFENKLEKLKFILQDGVFIVSRKGLESEGMSVYIYAKRAYELNSGLSTNSIIQECEKSKKLLEFECGKRVNFESDLTIQGLSKEEIEKRRKRLETSILTIEKDISFFETTLSLVKQLK